VPTDIKFSNRDEVRRWLSNKPREVAVVFAARAALRVAPLLGRALGPRGGAAKVGRGLVLPAFRGMAVSWVAGQYLTHGTEAARFAYAAAHAAARAAVGPAADAARAAAAAARAAAAADVGAARAAAEGAAYAAAHGRATADDARNIEEGASASALAARPLWLTEVPSLTRDAWQPLEAALLEENQDWQVWTDWYRARLEGRRASEALEVARILIADEIWNQGPRAVNAEIARLIAEYAPAPAPSAQEASPEKFPDVPSQRAAAVEPVWRGHLLTLPAQPAAQDLSEAEFIAALAGLRDDLREFADDLSGEANIDRRFLSYVRRFADRIPRAPPSQNELFRLGHVEEIFLGYARLVDSEWPEFLSVRYHALVLQCERTMRQSPLWRDFKRNAQRTTLTVEQIAAATPLAATAANALREGEARDFVDAPVPAALEALTQTLRQVSTAGEAPFDAIEAGNELLAADLIESVNNVLKRIAEAALTTAAAAGKALGEAGKTLAAAGQDYAKGFGRGLRKAAKKEGPKDGEKAFKWLRRLAVAGATGTGVFAGLSQLIAKFPQAFEWLERVLHFIK
jgi:hypothetical protein